MFRGVCHGDRILSFEIKNLNDSSDPVHIHVTYMLRKFSKFCRGIPMTEAFFSLPSLAETSFLKKAFFLFVKCRGFSQSDLSNVRTSVILSFVTIAIGSKFPALLWFCYSDITDKFQIIFLYLRA
jgi:hypothetical protein